MPFFVLLTLSWTMEKDMDEKRDGNMNDKNEIIFGG